MYRPQSGLFVLTLAVAVTSVTGEASATQLPGPSLNSPTRTSPEPATSGVLSTQTPAPPAPGTIRPLIEGPLHEAFLSPSRDRDPKKIDKGPPAPIVERPGVEAPDASAQWIPGYWEFDTGRNDFLWVTGTWRVAPPGKFWVNGYWKRDSEGWARVGGFWSDRKTDRIDFRKVGPPAEHPDDQPGDAPNDQSFYVPGIYTTDGDGVKWKPGYWAKAIEGWSWVPAQWVKQPEGWVFQDGYWDRTLEDRGTLFTPAEVTGGSQNSTGDLVYAPVQQVSPQSYNLLYGSLGRPYGSLYDGYPGCYYDPTGRYYGYASYGNIGLYSGYLGYPFYGGIGFPYLTASSYGYGGYGYGGYGGGGLFRRLGIGIGFGYPYYATFSPFFGGFGGFGFGYPYYGGFGYGGFGYGGFGGFGLWNPYFAGGYWGGGFGNRGWGHPRYPFNPGAGGRHGPVVNGNGNTFIRNTTINNFNHAGQNSLVARTNQTGASNRAAHGGGLAANAHAIGGHPNVTHAKMPGSTGSMHNPVSHNLAHQANNAMVGTNAHPQGIHTNNAVVNHSVARPNLSHGANTHLGNQGAGVQHQQNLGKTAASRTMAQQGSLNAQGAPRGGMNTNNVQSQHAGQMQQQQQRASHVQQQQQQQQQQHMPSQMQQQQHMASQMQHAAPAMHQSSPMQGHSPSQHMGGGGGMSHPSAGFSGGGGGGGMSRGGGGGFSGGGMSHSGGGGGGHR